MTTISSPADLGTSLCHIANLDLLRIALKIRHQCAKHGISVDEEDVAGRICAYRNFLELIARYPEEAIVPTESIDEVWHLHILDTQRYFPDCERIFGYHVEHYPYFGIHDEVDQANLQQAFAKTAVLYRQHFNDGAYDGGEASRCKDHACHKPDSCRCRTPSACDNRRP